jgi:hypothetical protein
MGEDEEVIQLFGGSVRIYSPFDENSIEFYESFELLSKLYI